MEYGDGMRWGSGEIKPSSDLHPIPSRSNPFNVPGRVWGYPCSCSSFTVMRCVYIHTDIKIPHLVVGIGTALIGGGGDFHD